MKIRNGFVSNSSSSSFICKVCGYTDAERDLNIADYEVVECENGHYICEEHLPKSLEELCDIGDDEINKLVVKENKRRIESEWGKSCLERHNQDPKNHYPIELEYITEDMREDFMEDYESELRYAYPSEHCPICNMNEIDIDDVYQYIVKSQKIDISVIKDDMRKLATSDSDVTKTTFQNYEINIKEE